VWVITNLTSGGSAEQIAFCVQSGVVKPLCDMLAVKEAKVIIVILEGLANILIVSIICYIGFYANTFSINI